jgi:hypothetical protein
MALQTVNLVAIGDSEFSVHAGTSIPAEVAAVLVGSATVTLTNFGVAGQTLNQQIGLTSTYTAAYNGSFNRNICLLHHGSNDTFATDGTLATWQGRAQTLVNSLVSAGFEVVSTEAYQWDFGNYPGSIFNTATDWNSYNSTVRSVTGISAYVNISAMPEFTNQSFVGQPPNYIDTQHLSAAGARLWASFAGPIMSLLIFGPAVIRSRRLRLRVR